MWKGSEVYDINHSDPKTLPWATPKLYQLTQRQLVWTHVRPSIVKKPRYYEEVLFSTPQLTQRTTVTNPIKLQLRNPTEQAFPLYPCLKQPVDGEAMWAKHHVFADPSCTKIAKEKQTVTFQKII